MEDVFRFVFPHLEKPYLCRADGFNGKLEKHSGCADLQPPSTHIVISITLPGSGSNSDML